MRIQFILATAVLAAAALHLAACGQDGPRGNPLEGGAPATTPTPMLPVNPHGALPTGHPPMDAPIQPAPPLGRPSMTPPANEGTDVFTWTAPATWTEGVASGMRAAQWDVPGTGANESPAQVVVFKGIGGTTDSNIERWVGMVTQPAGGSSKEKAKITKTTVGAITVTRLELPGGYSSNMGTPVNFTEALFLGAVVEQDGVKTTHVRFVGPAAVVAKEAANFDAFIASFAKK